MDKQAFKQRMQNLKSYRENNPGKGYWDWKVQAYQNGGRHALGVGQVFASLADMLFNKERRTPAIAAAAYYTIHQTQNDPVLAPVEAPLVEPRAISTVRRSTPTVKNYRSSLSNALDKAVKLGEKERRMSARLNNETYETVQRLMDDPSYMRRAQQVKEKYGDDYTQIYADLIDAYNNSPELLPKAKRTAFEDNARARMATTTESTKRHMDGGEFPKMGEYEYQYDINGVPYGTTIHEMNHNADYLKNKAADADANSNLYYWMRSALKPFSRIDPNTDKLTKYYSKPTEQKAYMNQLREFMYANKMIDTRDQIVTPDLIKQAISKLPKGMQSIKKASEQFKSMRSYTKWFNTIPLLGVGAVGANKYFTSNENRD